MSGTNLATRVRAPKDPLKGGHESALKGALKGSKGNSEAKSRSKSSDSDPLSEDLKRIGPRGPVAEVIQAYLDAFALTSAARLSELVPQPAVNALARRAIDRHGLSVVIAAVSISPRHRWIASEFLGRRNVPSLQAILSDKVLAQLVAEVSER